MKRVLYIMLVVISAVACERGDRLTSIEVIPSVDAYVGNRIVLEVSHTPENALTPAFCFKTDNPFVASVNNQGTIVCNHVGTCTVQVATADTRFSTACTVRVKPNNALFAEPVLDFSATKTAIKLKEADRTAIYETATVLIYQGVENPVQQVMYLFDDNRKLIASAVKLIAGASSELVGFMSEYYDRYPSAENSNILIWRGNSLEVVAETAADACFVVYNPFAGNSTCDSAHNTVEMFRKIVK